MLPPSSAKLPVGGLKATPLTGVTKTPLRGPLVERAIALREMCIKVLGMPLFLRAIEVRSERGPDGAGWHRAAVRRLRLSRSQVAELMEEGTHR